MPGEVEKLLAEVIRGQRDLATKEDVAAIHAEVRAARDEHREHALEDVRTFGRIEARQEAHSARLSDVERRAGKAEAELDRSGEWKAADLKDERKDRADARRHLVTTLVACGIALLSTGVAIASMIRH